MRKPSSGHNRTQNRLQQTRYSHIHRWIQIAIRCYRFGFCSVQIQYENKDMVSASKGQQQRLPSRATGNSKSRRMGEYNGWLVQHTLGQRIGNRSLNKPYNVNKTVDTIQDLVKNSNNKFRIRWVKAHVGIQGNEEADRLAKNAVLNDNKESKYNLTKSISNLKELLKTWHSNNGNSSGTMVTKAGKHTSTS